jgi:hypothetical protein
VSRFRLALALASAAVASAALAGPFKAKKVDAAKVRPLVEVLKSDPDERKRKAAADELGGADPREFPEVAAALTAALQKDASAAVRAEAAQSLGQLDQVFPHAGVALEAAAAGDASPLVRLAAKQTLWQYHLSGYRSPKGADGIAAQTVEPPIAAPAGERAAVALIPAPPPPSVSLFTPPSLPTAAPGPALPPVAPPAGPRLVRPGFLSDLVSGMRGPAAGAKAVPPSAGPPPILNVTAEPPVARKAAPVSVKPPAGFPVVAPLPVPPPTPVAVPPAPPAAPRQPDFASTLPPFMPDLPPVVLPPDATPFTPPKAPPKIPPTLPPSK